MGLFTETIRHRGDPSLQVHPIKVRARIRVRFIARARARVRSMVWPRVRRCRQPREDRKKVESREIGGKPRGRLLVSRRRGKRLCVGMCRGEARRKTHLGLALALQLGLGFGLGPRPCSVELRSVRNRMRETAHSKMSQHLRGAQTRG